MTGTEPRLIHPAGRGKVSVNLPPSKSYTQRALIAAALADGVSVVRNPSPSSDSVTMVRALRQFGIPIDELPGAFRIVGCAGRPPAGDRVIHVGNAGTCLRFLTGFSALVPGTTTLTGDPEMLRRPVSRLVEALRDAGVDACCETPYPPVTVRGGSPFGGRITLSASESSQFLSALLLIAPGCATPLEVTLTGSLSSAPYAAMTIALMRDFGVHISSDGSAYRLSRPGAYRGREYDVESDVSSATYFGAAAAITGNTVTIRGVRRDTLQGDIGFFPLISAMGCGVGFGDDDVTVSGGELRGVNADMNALPDSVPALAVAAAFASTPSTISGVEHLRHKETDRLSALHNELGKIGARTSVSGGEFTITPGPLRGAVVETYKDHRIAMSFAVAGLRLRGMRIIDPGCVAKSFPDFWTELDKFT